MKRFILLLSIYVFLIGGAGPAGAQDAERGAPMEFVLGASSFALTLPYGLVKLTYALGGSLTGGVAWVLTGGRSEIARAIVQPAVRGDYVIIPEHLTNDRALVFVGRDPSRDLPDSY
jgi:hypothetical protein